MLIGVSSPSPYDPVVMGPDMRVSIAQRPENYALFGMLTDLFGEREKMESKFGSMAHLCLHFIHYATAAKQFAKYT